VAVTPPLLKQEIDVSDFQELDSQEVLLTFKTGEPEYEPTDAPFNITYTLPVTGALLLRTQFLKEGRSNDRKDEELP
jgi:hypothetical protein